jgi:hypothetical protein
LCGLLGWGPPAGAAEMLGLYQGRAIVTGRGEESRQSGVAQALADVLTKVSGDARLLEDPRVAALAENAAGFVAAFDYRDRMAGIPVHDEQGSYDRPHDLTVTFEKAAIDAALRDLGHEPWGGPRPKLVLFVGVTIGDVAFALTADGEHGATMRESLAAAASKTGMPALLPTKAALAGAGLAAPLAAEAQELAAAARRVGGEETLAGTLVFSDAAGGWLVEWRLAVNGAPYAWRRGGVNFDEAFRVGLRGAAQVLSGNGAPR